MLHPKCMKRYEKSCRRDSERSARHVNISAGGGLLRRRRRRLMLTSPRSHPNICLVAGTERSSIDGAGALDAGTVKQLRLLPRSLLNPFHCSAVKSTSSPVGHSPPSAAFITKFMMRQFCVLFLHWSRFQGRTCSLGHRERKT